MKNVATAIVIALELVACGGVVQDESADPVHRFAVAICERQARCRVGGADGCVDAVESQVRNESHNDACLDEWSNALDVASCDAIVAPTCETR